MFLILAKRFESRADTVASLIIRNATSARIARIVITTMSSTRVNADFDRNNDLVNQGLLDEDDLNWSRHQENNENIREKMNCYYFITLSHKIQKYTRDRVYFEWMSF